MTPLTDKLLAVPVPQDAYQFYITHNNEELLYKTSTSPIESIKLSEGKCNILGLCSPMEIGFDPKNYIICGGEHDSSLWYMDYTYKEGEYQEWFDNPADSFRSLLQSKGLDSGHYLIIEKI